MRTLRRILSGLVAVTIAAAGVACGGSTTDTNHVSLAGNYTLTGFSYNGTDYSQAATGTATLTSTNYSVNIQFAQNAFPAIVDDGTYTATTSGTLTLNSAEGNGQATGTYTYANGVLTETVNQQGATVQTVWQAQ
jgi:hypothetical protein